MDIKKHFPDAKVETLTELQYSNDRKGPFALYIYGPDGFHSGKTWCRRIPQYPEEGEISCGEMLLRTMEAAVKGLEVRICDGGDMLVYHCKGANVLHPKPIGDFWKEIGA